MSFQARLLLVYLAAGVLAPAALASTLDPVSARDRLVRADLVVATTVVAVEHRVSTIAGAGDAALPHTFVTFAVERTIKGIPPSNDRITLRFQGGPDGLGRALKVVGVPDFQAGERDILFVRNNGVALCPLVGWEQGRLRVAGDQVFAADGRELWLAPSGDFVFGERRLDLEQFPYGEIAPPAGDGFAPPAGSVRPAATALASILEQAAAGLYAGGAMTPPAPVADASPHAAFRARAVIAGTAPVDHGGAAQQEPAQDRAERIAAEQREAAKGGN